MSFLEERLSEQFAFGSSVTQNYSFSIHRSAGGNEYRNLLNPYPKVIADLDFDNKTESWMYANLVDFYNKTNGGYDGFRWRNPSDYSTNGLTGTPTFSDQLLSLSSAGVYQLQKWYGTEGVIDASRRLIKKPVDGSVLISIVDDNGDTVQVGQYQTGSPQVARWTVGSTGLITFAANNQKVITNISQAGTAEVTVGTHTYEVGDSVHFSGVSGMTEINGKRATIQSTTATTITVDINSSAYTAFSSASPLGQVNTRPQTNEIVRGGCEFDLPMRFDGSLPNLTFNTRSGDDNLLSVSVSIIEILNP